MPRTESKVRKEIPTVNRIILRLSLVSFGLALGVVVFEGYLRFTGQGSGGFWQPDPYIGAFHIPNKHGLWQRDCFKTWVTFNSRGLRDVEHKIEKPEGVYRIVVLGDSYAEALQVKLEESFPRVLERLLNEANLGKSFEVINLGNSGFGTDQEYLSLKHYGLEYGPDLVLLAFLTGNDVRNNYHVLERQTHNWPKPFFVFDEHGNLVQLPFEVSSQDPATWLRRSLAKFWIYGWMREKVYASPALHRLFWRIGLVMVTPPDNKQPQGAQEEAPKIPLDFQVFLEVYPPEWEEAWKITKALILKTKEEAARHRARFLLVSLTDGIQLVDPDRVRGEYPGFAGVRYNMDKPVEVLTELARAKSIDYLKLLPIFRQYLEANRGGTVDDVHYPCDGHWTPLGHSLAAEAMFKKIVADRLYEHQR